jgi:hypothetical protein
MTTFDLEYSLRDYTQMKKMTINELQQHSPGFPWLAFINKVFARSGTSQQYNGNEIIEIDSLVFFRFISDFLPKLTQSQLEAYIFWNSMIKMLPRLPAKYSYPLRVLDQMLYGTSTQAPSTLWTCLSEAYEVQDMALARFYIQRSFPGRVSDCYLK